MTSRPYDDIREQVSCLDAGERYGLTVNRSGFALCPWHNDRKPSLKLYGPGRGCYCFSCGHSADVIGLTSELLGTDRAGAARQINVDYALGLPLDRPPDRAERERAEKRRQVSDIYKDFELWREDTTRLLSNTFRLGWSAEKDIPESLWFPAEVEAIKMRETLDYWLELLGGGIEEQMQIFVNRKQVTEKCKQILNSMPERFRED